MTRTALALALLFYLVGFLGRGWLQYRRTGDWGYRGFSGRPFSAVWWGGVMFFSAGIAAVAAPVLDLAGTLPLLVTPPAAVRAAGLALAVLGSLGMFAAQLQMGDSWRVGVDETEATALVAHGFYRWVRNPIYSWMLAAFAGFVVAVPNAVAVGALVTAVVGLELHVRLVEEPHLRRVHGAAWVRYAEAVGRFVPGLGLLRG